MAQNLTSGSQAFGMASVSGGTGKTVAIVDGEGSVLGSFTAVYDFDTVVASVSGMQDGETYGIVRSIRSRAPMKTATRARARYQESMR